MAFSNGIGMRCLFGRRYWFVLNPCLRILYGLILIALFSNPVLAGSPRPIIIKDISHTCENDHCNVTITLSSDSTFKWAELKEQGKIYVDIKDAILSFGLTKPITVESDLIKRIRFAQYDRKTVRVVLDINKYKSFNVNNSKESINRSPSDKIEVDIYGPDAVFKQQAVQKPVAPVDESSEPVKTAKAAKPPESSAGVREESEPVRSSKNLDARTQSIPRKGKSGRFRIVLDPGHGGHDPGATSITGLEEKLLTLDVSMRVARILRSKYGVEVYLTRYRDYYLTLEQRTEIANKKKADLFISIHANASNNSTLNGLETFLLNWANDNEAIAVAARENEISVKKMKDEGSELNVILTSLAREGKRDESLRLAHLIHGSMLSRLRRGYTGVGDLGVRQAVFYVLVGAKMPSALIEIGFLTNPREERLLRKSDYREDLAYSVASGIYQYISTVDNMEASLIETGRAAVK